MKKISIHILFLILFTSFFIRADAQTEVLDYKAKLIFNLTRLVEWPINYKNQDFIITIYGNSTLYNHLAKLIQNRKVGANSIIVKKIKSVEEIDKIHILYVSSLKSTKKEFEAILDKLNGKSTLLITEKEGLTNSGSAINFVVRDNILKFELKESNATKYKLKISSKLKDYAIVI